MIPALKRLGNRQLAQGFDYAAPDQVMPGSAMDYGFFGFNTGPLSNPGAIERVVVSAEQLGYESVWSAEHLVMMDPEDPLLPVPPKSNLVGSIASLAFAAAKTQRISIGSGIILIALRDPIMLAKELAAVDVLSGGRLLAGFGVGFVPREFETLGIPFEERGPRTSEHIEVLRTLWTEEQPAFDGQFTKFSGVQSRPLPVQKPHPPIILGGDSPPALRRAVAQADGWYSFHDVEGTAQMLKALEAAAKTTERPASLGRLNIIVSPFGPIDADTANRYEDLGVDRLVLVRDSFETSIPPSREAEDTIVRFLEDQAREIGIG